MTVAATETGAAMKPPRIGLLDTARGIALIAMASYHFTWDMEFMGYLVPGTAETGWLKIYARVIASTFLFLAGLSLVLASHPEIRWRSYWKRFAMIAASAVVISVGTYIAMPGEWIFFGILHCIAALSLIGIVFLMLPATATYVVTVALLAAWITDTFIAPGLLSTPMLDAKYLAWIGFADMPPRSNDYVPLFPWATAFFSGLSLASIVIRTQLPKKLAALASGPGLLAKVGRHSLAFYLIHQPVLFGIAYGLSVVAPPAPPDPVATYLKQCNTSCVMQQGEALCRAFCQCTLDKLQAQSLLIPLQSRQIDVENDDRIQTLAAQCSADAQP